MKEILYNGKQIIEAVKEERDYSSIEDKTLCSYDEFCSNDKQFFLKESELEKSL